MIIKKLTLTNNDGKEFNVKIFLNLASIRAIEKELRVIDKKNNFYNCLPLIDKGFMTETLIYICNTVHLENDREPVGVDWFDNNDIDFLHYSKDLVTALAQCLADNKSTVESKGK